MSDAEELAHLICRESTSIGKDKGLHIANAILAAGFRRIPDDCVVVTRLDATDSLHCVKQYHAVLDEDQIKGHFMLVEKRLKAALTATRPGNDNE